MEVQRQSKNIPKAHSLKKNLQQKLACLPTKRDKRRVSYHKFTHATDYSNTASNKKYNPISSALRVENLIELLSQLERRYLEEDRSHALQKAILRRRTVNIDVINLGTRQWLPERL